MTEYDQLADAIIDDDTPAIDVLASAAIPQSEHDPRNPAAAYLLGLASSSRRVMRGSLITLAYLLGVSDVRDAEENNISHLVCPWWRLRYPHTVALRSRLQQPIYRPKPDGQPGRKPVELLAPATAQRHLAALTGVLKECWRLGLMGIEDYHRAIDLRPIRGEREPAGRALSPGEMSALLYTCAIDHRLIGRRDQAIIAILYGGGLRRSEVVGLDLDDYDADRGALHIRAGKGNKERTAYLPDGACETLNAWLHVRCTAPQPTGQARRPLFLSFRKGVMTGRPFDEERLHAMIVERCAQANVRACRPHDFRRTFIGDLLSAGVDIATVQRLVGHADPATTTRYDRRPDAARREAVKRLHVPVFTPPSRAQG